MTDQRQHEETTSSLRLAPIGTYTPKRAEEANEDKPRLENGWRQVNQSGQSLMGKHVAPARPGPPYDISVSFAPDK